MMAAMINQVLSFLGDQLCESLLFHMGHWSISQMHILGALLTSGLGDLRYFWETLSKKMFSHCAALPDCCVQGGVSKAPGDSGPGSGLEKLRHRGAVTVLHGDVQRGLKK